MGNHQTSTPFTLTLIRRDPGTGHQWNVGQISSYQLGQPPEESGGPEDDQAHYFPHQPPSPTRPRLSDSPIDIRIETSGYAKFRNRAAGRPTDLQSLVALAKAQEASNLTLGGMFARRVTMAYTKSWTSNLREKFTQARNRHARSISAPSTESLDFDPHSDSSSGSGPGPGMKPRGYTFASPWDGRCEFRTGNAGRSLRCHHLLHEGQTAAYNPLVADPNEPSHRAPSSVVSELRFNLPSSELLGAPSAPGTATSTGHDGSADDNSKTIRLGHFAKLLRPGGSDRSDDFYEDDLDDAVSPFDVNVGRERAGGGNRGKRAKLGKLIVYNDGLKMLDLLVAANIGVWWLAWERSF
jgi:hypothetical protein